MVFSITHYYSRISVNIWYWSQRSRNPAGWPCRRYATRLPGLDWEPLAEQVPGVEMCLSQVSDVSGGQRRRGRLCRSTSGTGTESSFKGHRGAGERCSTAPPPPPPPPRGSGLASYLLGADLPAALRGGGGRCFHFWAAITRAARCRPPTCSAPARYAPEEVPTWTAIRFPLGGRASRLASLTQCRQLSPHSSPQGWGMGWERRPLPLPLPTGSTWATTQPRTQPEEEEEGGISQLL